MSRKSVKFIQMIFSNTALTVVAKITFGPSLGEKFGRIGRVSVSSDYCAVEMFVTKSTLYEVEETFKEYYDLHNRLTAVD